MNISQLAKKFIGSNDTATVSAIELQKLISEKKLIEIENRRIREELEELRDNQSCIITNMTELNNFHVSLNTDGNVTISAEILREVLVSLTKTKNKCNIGTKTIFFDKNERLIEFKKYI